MRVNLYLHADLDLDAAEAHWSGVARVPRSQFTKAYRAAVDDTMRANRHVFGCCHVRYHSTADLRAVMGLIEGMILVSSAPTFRGSSAGRAFDC